MKFVTPKTFLVGTTSPDIDQIIEYLKHTGQTKFVNAWNDAISNGVEPAEALVSVMAKICYSSLVQGKNENLTQTRSIEANIAATIGSGHGSVLEHITMNFITTGCSRVFTHELVRHRVGTAFSQTSGRYVRTDEIEVVMDPILEPARAEIQDLIETIEMRKDRIAERVGLGKPGESMSAKTFDEKKKLTSALRRVLPNGQANEIGWSANVRTLRHLIQLRTSRAAEWEIRKVFCEVFVLCRRKFPMLFADAKLSADMGGNLFEVYGMTMQPYGDNHESNT